MTEAMAKLLAGAQQAARSARHQEVLSLAGELLEQASAAAHSLLEQAGQLDDMMAKYVVAQDSPTPSMLQARVA